MNTPCKLNCTLEELNVTAAKWYRNRLTPTHAAWHLRLGQYIWKEHGVQGTSWPELFYQRDPDVALDVATKHVIECET